MPFFWLAGIHEKKKVLDKVYRCVVMVMYTVKKGDDAMVDKEKDDRMVFRVNDAERIEFVDASMDRNLTITELVKRSIRFYTGFPPGFIEKMEEVAKAYETDVSTLVARLLMVYISQDNAILNNFGVSRTHKYAFALDDRGTLIPVDKISEFVYQEMDKVCKKTLKKLIRTSETGEDSVLTKDEAVLIPKLKDRGDGEWGVKSEARYPKMASAKGK